jgi:putative restriction endonuclease
MAKGVFLHRADSIYDDEPHERYQFPASYLSRASQCVGDWIIYLEPTKAGNSGYHALAKVERIVPDPTTAGTYIALIEHGSYLPFEKNVPFKDADGYPERSVANDAGKPSGRAQAAMRVIPDDDFNRIVMRGIPDEDALLPREGTYPADATIEVVSDVRRPFFYQEERRRTTYFNSRVVRDRVFRRKVLDAYGSTCAFTGLKFVNGGGRVEAEAAHIIPVEENGPDIV